MSIFSDIKNLFVKKPVPVQRVQSKKAYTGIYPSYNAGMSGGAKWDGGLSGDGSSFYIDHYRTRQNARKADRENVHARAVVRRFTDNVVDKGRYPKPDIDHLTLGISLEEKAVIDSAMERTFFAWGSSKKSHRSEVNTFWQNQRLYSDMQHRDNDMFWRYFYTFDFDAINPVQIEFLDANQIRGQAWTSSFAQVDQKDGINRDVRNREKSYDVWYYDGSDYIEKTIPRIGAISGRYLMLHGFSPDYPGQMRGISRIAPALQEFQNLTDLSLATIMKAINAANWLFWVEPSADADAHDPVAEVGSLSDADITRQNLINEARAALTAPPSTEEIDRTVKMMPELKLSKPGGAILGTLKKGEKIKDFQPQTPGEEYGKYVEAFMSYLCASTGMAIEVLLMKFSNNYSASRATLILFWRIAMIWGAEMDSDFNNPTYEMVISEEVAAGRLSLPGFSDPRLRAAYLRCHWHSVPMPNIDPLKQTKADENNIKMNVTNLELIAQQNGTDIAQNIAINNKYYQQMQVPGWEQTQAIEQQQIIDDGDKEDGENV